MSLHEPLLEQYDRSVHRRESVLWPMFRSSKKPGVEFEKRIVSKSSKINNQNVYTYESDQNPQTGNTEIDILQYSNLSFKSSQRVGMRRSNFKEQNIKQQENSLQNIQQQVSQTSCTELLIGESQFSKPSPSIIAINKQKQKDHIQRLQIMKKKKQQYLTIRQKLDKFFGDGINSLILTLPQKTINFLSINILFDIIARIGLIFISFYFFFQASKKQNFAYIFVAPLSAVLFSRILFIMTLIKMNYGQKSAICIAYQKAFDTRSFLEIQNDRLFRKHYGVSNIFKSIKRSLIPAQISYFWINPSPQRFRIYFLMNMIFKGIQIMIVLPMFVMSLFIGQQLSKTWQLICVSYLLEQSVRYVINFLIINTLSK